MRVIFIFSHAAKAKEEIEVLVELPKTPHLIVSTALAVAGWL